MPRRILSAIILVVLVCCLTAGVFAQGEVPYQKEKQTVLGKYLDKHSYFKGKRMRNGWKNSVAPWTYNLDPELVYSTATN